MALLGQLYLPILADVITPFMFVTGARLLCANLLIAFIESLILRHFFSVRPGRLFGWMVLANYFSAIVGGVLLLILAGATAAAFRPMLFHLRSYLLTMFIIAMLLSFILELPFVLAARRKRPGSMRNSVLACAAAQLGSYAVLLPIYLLVTRVHVAGEVNPVNSLDFVDHKAARVLFLSPEDTSVYQIQLDGSPAQKLFDMSGRTPRTSPDDLTICKADDADRWDLWLTDMWNYPLSNATGSDKPLRKGVAARYPPQDESHPAQVVDWRPVREREWDVDMASDAPDERLGLKAHNSATGEDIHVVLNTPFVSWYARCPTFLPGNQLVFELSGQIVVLDLKTRKLGFVTYGHSPVVILPN